VKAASGTRVSAEQWLRQPTSRVAALVGDGFELEPTVGRLDIPSVEITLKYEGYLKRQELDILRRARDEHRRIPREFLYASVPGLSSEVVQRLNQVRPETIGQAMRVPGITPAAITVLSTYVSRVVSPKLPCADVTI
jgi:tRNA uridine 5-carboxymethylaminomethyl modification enzyme